ncbi:hypothetical protein AcV5_000328 [Taiwanofungus camphoratus]|nr:hypothetical protein AcV7_003519 [Antrodia cinnamomea]KAI0938710.1 hypothetical protein AcV5_000328 [Antrodia cinnamomea]
MRTDLRQWTACRQRNRGLPSLTFLALQLRRYLGTRDFPSQVISPPCPQRTSMSCQSKKDIRTESVPSLLHAGSDCCCRGVTLLGLLLALPIHSQTKYFKP